MNVVATITKADRWDPIALVDRRGWSIEISDGRTKRTTTRSEAREWCAEMGIVGEFSAEFVRPILREDVDDWEYDRLQEMGR